MIRRGRTIAHAIRPPRRQAGAAIFVLMVTLALIGVGATTAMLSGRTVDAAADARTEAALGVARDALIGYATSRGTDTGTARPGEFPCPDADGDGRENLQASLPGAACVASLGRIPWVTLGIPEPTDSAGETLWYALAAPFRNFASNGTPINSDTSGNLVVRVAGTTAPVTTQAVAVVFSPGEALGGQNRSASGTGPCGAAPKLCASNYLESYDGVDNTAANGPYISVPAKKPAGFNDRLVFIRATDVMPAVEERVGQELRTLLTQYGNAANLYPWAADWSVTGGATFGTSAVGLSRGRFPIAALPVAWNAVAPTGLTTPRLPDWVAQNQWQRVVYYTAGKGMLATPAACTTCAADALSFAGDPAEPGAVLLTPGTPFPNATRSGTALASYFESATNQLACLTSITTQCDAYVEPPSARSDRDRIFLARKLDIPTPTIPLPPTPAMIC